VTHFQPGILIKGANTMNEREKDKLFVELSIDLGFINAADAAAAFQEQKIDEAVGAKKPVGAYLVASGKLTREQVGKVVAMQEKLIARNVKSQVAATPAPQATMCPPEWKSVFDLIERAGGPKMPDAEKLSLNERISVYFSVWGFLLGPIYYLAKGMWKKGITLFVGGIAIIVTLITAIGQDMAFTNFIIPAIFSSRANIDYYKKIIMNDNGWY